MVEDIVGWILEAGGANVLQGLNVLKDPSPQSIAQVVEYLKEKKVDIVAYETVADVVANDEACRARAASLFSGMAAACKGIQTQHFRQDAAGIWVFQQ